MDSFENFINLLPGTNCKACGFTNCYSFACKLYNGQVLLTKCTLLYQDQFKENISKIETILETVKLQKSNKVFGLIDNMEADFVIHPLKDEPTCRVTLASFSAKPIEKGSLIKYRPLGCPITHYSRVIKVDNGLIEVWEAGPCNCGEEETPVDLGICLILSFHGKVEGQLPNIGQTVKFLTNYCMMGKIHAGIVVQIEDGCARIDGIDFKIWQHAPQLA
jgi:uncharacterized protein